MEIEIRKIIILSTFFLSGFCTVKTNAELIAYWKFDETTGSEITDSSGNDNIGTIHGELVWVPTGGKFGGAVRCGQTDNDYIEIPLTKLSVSQGTISLWVKLGPDPQPTRHRYLVGHSTSPFMSNRIQLFLHPGALDLCLGLGDSHGLANTIKPLQPGTWCHIALTWDNGNYVLYIDGRSKTNGTYSGFENLNTIADIGNDGRNDGLQRDEAFNGLVDDALLFNHALNQNEIMQLYHGAGDLFTNEPFVMLLDNIHQAGQISSPRETVDFLANKTAEYQQWEQKNPKDAGPHHKRLSCELYFLLAKARESANTPAGQIAEAYKQSISQLQYRQNYVPALLWLFDNTSTENYIEAIKKSASKCNNVPENLNLIAKDFEISGNWKAFELYLDAVLEEIDDSTSFGQAMDAGLNKNGLWFEHFSRYARNKSQLNQYCIETYKKNAEAKAAQNNFIEAAEVYQNVANMCHSNKDKETCRLKSCACLFNSGQCSKAQSELDNLIKDISISKDTIAKAMLLKGQILLQLNDINNATKTYSSVINEYPQTDCVPEAHFFMGYCNLIEGKYEEALKSLSLLTDKYPQSTYAGKANLCLARIKKETE